MPNYVALLKGINVGANRRITMTALRELAEGLGFANVETYINSGNVVFTSELFENGQIGDNIHSAIQRDLHMDVPVIVRSGAEMQQIVEGNPFPERADDPATLMVSFLSSIPDPEKVAKLTDLQKGDDDYLAVGNDVYLSYPNKVTGAVFTPDGLEKALGVTATTRNWATVTKLAEMTSV